MPADYRSHSVHGVSSAPVENEGSAGQCTAATQKSAES